MIIEASTIMQNLHVQLIVKAIALVFIGMYAIFSLMLATKIRSFNKILFLPPNSGGNLMQRLTILYTIIVAVLFLFTLIML